MFKGSRQARLNRMRATGSLTIIQHHASEARCEAALEVNVGANLLGAMQEYIFG